MDIKNYTARNPCPICGRYKTAGKNKCHGFLTTDSKYAYCSREMTEGQPQRETFYGKPIYRHSLTTKEHSITAMPSPSATALYTEEKKSKPKKDKPLQNLYISERWRWHSGPSRDNIEALEKVIQEYQDLGKWPFV